MLRGQWKPAAGTPPVWLLFDDGGHRVAAFPTGADSADDDELPTSDPIELSIAVHGDCLTLGFDGKPSQLPAEVRVLVGKFTFLAIPERLTLTDTSGRSFQFEPSADANDSGIDMGMELCVVGTKIPLKDIE